MSRGGTPVFWANKARLWLDYTPRQLAILDDEIPLDEIRTTELVAIIKKATARLDGFNLDIANDLLELKKHPSTYFPSMTVEEAKETLQELTPWKLDW